MNLSAEYFGDGSSRRPSSNDGPSLAGVNDASSEASRVVSSGSAGDTSADGLDDGVSLIPRGDASSGAGVDASSIARADGRCAWCRRDLRTTRATYCGQRCRQTAFRLRRRRTTATASALPGRFAYADPPYPGLAARYYGQEPDFEGEVDHRVLIASLVNGDYTGWALSTSRAALRELLPMCPEGAHVCPWLKPGGVPRATFGLHSCWEALIVVGGRATQPGRRDFLVAHPARGGAGLERAELPGRKPIAFAAFLFDALGMLPGDELEDLFPGSGLIGRAWAELSLRSSTTLRADTEIA